LLLDVRETWEWDICRIQGSRHLPMRMIPHELKGGSLATLDREQPLVVICHHGIRSQQVALYLDQQGFSNVLNLRGGIDAWARDVEPGMASY
jgi:rhodanese-related sulfurtransferase